MPIDAFRQLMKGIQGKFNVGMGVNSQTSQQVAFIRQLQKEMMQDHILHTPLNQLDVVIFDIETTGFYPENGDEIISIGAIKVRKGELQEKEVFYSLVRYENELSDEVENLTGLKSEQLKEAPPLSEVLVTFFEFVKNNTLVAHHAKHEKNFLQNASWRLFRTPFKHRIVDTSFLCRVVEPKLNLYRLEDLCEHNDIAVVDRHHALGDAKLAAKLWCGYVKKASEAGCRTLSDVYERLSRI